MALISSVLSIPAIQTKLAKYTTESINEKYNVNLVIKKVDLSFLGSIQLREIEIRDHHKDTLIFVDNLQTSLLNAQKAYNGELKLGKFSLNGVDFLMKTYKGEKNDSFNIFIESFYEEPINSLSKPFVLTTAKILLSNLKFRLINENYQKKLVFSAENLLGIAEDFKLVGSNINLKAKGWKFKDNEGLEVERFSTDFSYSISEMVFKNTFLQTKKSDIRLDMKFSYTRKDLADFNNKVQISAAFNPSKIYVKDLKKYYNEFSSEAILDFSGDFFGTLNDFKVDNFDVSSNSIAKIVGKVAFVNAINDEKGFQFLGDFKEFKTTYKKITALMPNVLGKRLPKKLDQLGAIDIVGKVTLLTNSLDLKTKISTEIGTVFSNLKIDKVFDFENAIFKDDVTLINFDVGRFLNVKSLGKTTFSSKINGKGFELTSSELEFESTVKKVAFNKYNYKNLTIKSSLKKNFFKINATVLDDALKMKFNGTADFSSKMNAYKLHSDISYLNLKETNWYLKDAISRFRGVIDLKIKGNSVEEISGDATFDKLVYVNEVKAYFFEPFSVNSSFKNNEKNIQISSKDVVDGFIKGAFSFDELIPVTQNALGSIYANYSPFKVAKNQQIEFDLKVYNQFVNLFFKDIEVDNRTTIKGRISSTDNYFKLNFSSPIINAYGNEVKDIVIRSDNKNPLYNTHITASEFNTEYYNISKLNLLNRTQNDTLFFKSVFKGRSKNNENFNFDFYYTFNEEGKSVLGFQESFFQFKKNSWEISPKDKKSHQITFDLSKSDYNFSEFKLIADQQKVEFSGSLKGNEEKELHANFENVYLRSFLPKIDSLSLKGKLSGQLDFVQKEGEYSPEGNLLIDNFQVNDFDQGDLALNIKGKKSFEIYGVDISLKNEKVKNIAATGVLDFSADSPLIDLEVFLEEFGLDAYGPLGQDVLSSVRGSASGNFTLRGFLRNPEMNGVLSLKDAGLKFPFLNIDYNFDNASIITLQEQSFYLNDITLKDSKYETKGILNGRISHLNFDLWELDMNIDSENLLVLDTQNTEDALYFGAAFLEGNASITGLTDQLTIDVNGKTKDGTVFVIPLKDVETVNSYKLIHFKSDTLVVKERQKKIAEEALKGIALNIKLDVNKDAEAKVVIDEINGSQLSGNGTGNLDIRIDTRGKFEMFGDYSIDKGFYDFKYGGIVNKAFSIQNGSTVSWDGDPFQAKLNVTAIYKANANPGVLLQNFNSNRNIEIDLVTKITGGLFDSKQDLDIQLTNVDPSIATELEFILNDNNQNEKTKQFVSLLAFDQFVNPESFRFDANEVITNTASNVISSALSSLINSPNSRFKLDVGYRAESVNDVNQLSTDSKFDVSLSAKVSDRILINGKVGVPVGAKTQSSVVGEVKIEVLLNKDGSFRTVIFNRENEIQYSTQEEGYTKGIGLTYQVNFNNFSGLMKKIGLKKDKKKKKVIKKDSANVRRKELINFEGN